MTTKAQVSWGEYNGYEGPFLQGTTPLILSESPTDAQKILAVVTSTEGGRADAINAYDRCIISAGFIQLCENSINGCSNLLGAIAEHSLNRYGISAS